jgi:signal transduction histidine kinase
MAHRRLLAEERPGTLRFGGVRIALLDVEASFWGLRRQLEALVGRRLTDAVLQQAGVNGGVSFAHTFIGPNPADGAQALYECVAAYQAAGFGQFQIEALEWPIGRALIRGTETFEAWMMRQHGQKADTPVCAYTAGVLVGFVNELSGRRDVVCVKHACQGKGDDTCLFELLPAGQVGETPVIAFDPDPFLSRQLNLLALLFDRMPMGIAIFDRHLVLRRFNPTWATFIDRYTPSTAGQVVPGAHFFHLAPGTEATMTPIVQRVLEGETVRQEALRLESGGIVSYWDAAFTPLVEGDQVVGLMDVMTDATERVSAYQTLEQRVEERTREIERKRQATIAEERSRLARELHDAVTQTIFSATLIAEVLPRLWERNPDKVRQGLEDLRQLTRGALAEMRTLLLELRPAALMKAELDDLFRQLAEATAGRTGVPIALKVEGECAMPPDVRVALYRIAQEALNNIARHARACQAAMDLRCRPGRVELRIDDDGGGFDLGRIPPERMGLNIMRERAGSIGATLEIETQIGHGTQVAVVWEAGE